jgi:hypothetical protein
MERGTFFLNKETENHQIWKAKIEVTKFGGGGGGGRNTTERSKE